MQQLLTFIKLFDKISLEKQTGTDTESFVLDIRGKYAESFT